MSLPAQATSATICAGAADDERAFEESVVWPVRSQSFYPGKWRNANKGIRATHRLAEPEAIVRAQAEPACILDNKARWR
jgi:hypothetical protein